MPETMAVRRPWTNVRAPIRPVRRSLLFDGMDVRRKGGALMGDRSISQFAPEDVKAVTRVATEYFQSWFAGDGERMRACLHPALAKRAAEKPGTETLVLHESPTDRLVAATASGGGTRVDPGPGVTGLGAFRDRATETVPSAPSAEYVHPAPFRSSRPPV